MGLVLNSGLPAGTRGLWWFAQDLQNLGSAFTGDAIPQNGATYPGAFVLHDATPDVTVLSGNAALLIPTTEITIMFHARAIDATLRAANVFGISTATAAQLCGAHMPYSDGIVYWDFGGNTVGVTRLTAAWTKDTTDHVWAFTTGARGMEIWRDGVKIASNAATPTRSAVTTTYFALGRHTTIPITDLYEYRWMFIHETQLSEALIAAISADPEGELTETAGPQVAPPFEPPSWRYRGAVMPSRPFSEVPTGAQALFNDALYIAYAGEYQNQTVGYPQPTNVRVGAIVRTTDGGTWETVFNGAVAAFGHLHWQPIHLFTIGTTLFAVIFSGGFNFIASNAYIPAGELALMSSPDGTTWTKIHTFHSWATQNNGTSPVNVAVFALAAYWHAERSSVGGDDWIIVSWSVRCDGSGGSFFEAATQRLRSPDGGATWNFVADMKGVYPFTANPFSIDGPSSVTPIWRSNILGDRWFMFGGTGSMNWSDDEGATWTPTTWSGLTPFTAFSLNSGGMVIFTHGSASFAPDVKVSCDLGVTAVVVPSGDSYQGATPANVQVAVLQFNAAEELLVAVRDNSGTSTSLWYTTNGGELWTELGQLPTIFTVPTYLAWFNGRVMLYTATTAIAGGPQVWVTEDDPTGEVTSRSICPLLNPNTPEFTPDVLDIVYDFIAPVLELVALPVIRELGGSPEISPILSVRPDGRQVATPTPTQRRVLPTQ